MTDDIENAIGTEPMIREFVTELFKLRYPEFADHQAEADAFIQVLKVAQLEICHFPEGQHKKDDEGALKIAIGTENNKVVVKFGKKIAWIGFNKVGALSFINALRSHAMTIK